ncbi:hypothetical protein GCM10011572_16090 [Pseudoduganella buxea]|uniref:Uncharacterized protein n=1 Tax=Pseudoduganella buxea TaxID=1949069 RepID=A0ABQ1KDP1_9BURK|nr:hypothetical protein GCM10011572_16090 [Pseudoduganella buxea]
MAEAAPRLDSDQARLLKELQEQSERLKNIVAKLSSHKTMLAAAIKKMLRTDKRMRVWLRRHDVHGWKRRRSEAQQLGGEPWHW